MSKVCTTHHFACDCREQMIQKVCEYVLNMHKELKQFMAGLAEAKICNCNICNIARTLSFPPKETDQEETNQIKDNDL